MEFAPKKIVIKLLSCVKCPTCKRVFEPLWGTQTKEDLERDKCINIGSHKIVQVRVNPYDNAQRSIASVLNHDNRGSLTGIRTQAFDYY